MMQVVKPTFRVHELVYCPSMKIPPSALPYLQRGSLAHMAIESELEARGCETEVEITIDRGFYYLQGHVDAIDHDKRIVYEIKPNLKCREYIIQLSAYVEMAEERYGRKYSGAFILYSQNGYVIQHVTVKRGVLKSLDKVAEALILVTKSGRILVKRNCFCDRCAFMKCPVKYGLVRMATLKYQ